jgi:hypothetical protein
LHDSLAAKTGANVFERVFSHIARLAPKDWEVCPASDEDSDHNGKSNGNDQGGNREYFAGVFRGINYGLPIHCDWTPNDTQTEDWIIRNDTHQVVFN